MFLAASIAGSILKLHITSTYDHLVQPLTTILNNYTLNKKLLNIKWCEKRKFKPNFII